MNKRGLSTIIVTLILIVVSLVAVAIFWVVVRNLISQQSEGISFEKFAISMDIKKVYSPGANDVAVEVERNPGKAELSGINFIFYTDSGSELITQNIPIGELETKTFTLTLQNITAADVTKVSIAPIFKANSEIGSIAASYQLTGPMESGSYVCTPNSCSALGYNCGNWANGTCSGSSLFCGSCSGGMVCNSNGICVSSCSPTTCSTLGFNCGTPANGTCSGTLNCGTCSGGQTCSNSSGGICQTVSCNPTTCLALGYNCGTWNNGSCSGSLNCGSCSSGYACVGGSCVVQPIGNFKYVRTGATGTNNGSDWTNAYTALPSTLTRGSTYYIADGSYGSYTFDDATSGTQYITIKKAISSDHGTDLGWQSSYGDGVALFSTLTFNTNYWTFDGQTGGGPGSWTSGHGFEVEKTPPNNCAGNGDLITFGTGVSNINIVHSHIHSNNYNYPINGIKGTSGANAINISYNYIHNTFGPLFHLGNWRNVIIQKNYLSYVRSTGVDPLGYCNDWHAEGISSIGNNLNFTIADNIWDNIQGTAVIAGVNNGNSTDWKIYNNIFSRSVTTIYYYYESGSNKQIMQNLRFYSNIIVGINGESQGGIVIQNGANNNIYNNIWYDNIINSLSIDGNHNYNFFSENRRLEGCEPTFCEKDTDPNEANDQVNGPNPFVNYPTPVYSHTSNINPEEVNFHLVSGSSAINSGTNLGGSPYNLDLDGISRPQGSAWDIGAYEYH